MPSAYVRLVVPCHGRGTPVVDKRSTGTQRRQGRLRVPSCLASHVRQDRNTVKHGHRVLAWGWDLAAHYEGTCPKDNFASVKWQLQSRQEMRRSVLAVKARSSMAMSSVEESR